MWVFWGKEHWGDERCFSSVSGFSCSSNYLSCYFCRKYKSPKIIIIFFYHGHSSILKLKWKGLEFRSYRKTGEKDRGESCYCLNHTDFRGKKKRVFQQKPELFHGPRGFRSPLWSHVSSSRPSASDLSAWPVS